MFGGLGFPVEMIARPCILGISFPTGDSQLSEYLRISLNISESHISYDETPSVSRSTLTTIVLPRSTALCMSVCPSGRSINWSIPRRSSSLTMPSRPFSAAHHRMPPLGRSPNGIPSARSSRYSSFSHFLLHGLWSCTYTMSSGVRP